MSSDGVDIEQVGNTSVADLFDEGTISMVGSSEADQYELAPSGAPTDEDIFETGFIVSRNDLGFVGRSTQWLRNTKQQSQLVLGDCGYNTIVYTCLTATVCGGFMVGFLFT
jgi:hypothetical protein